METGRTLADLFASDQSRLIRPVVSYRGEVRYCYAHCAGMLLGAYGHDVDPELIEVASGIGLGATLLPSNLLMLSHLPPDVGIDQAFQRLGFTVARERSDDRTMPWERLSSILRDGPAILGPVDMALLPYRRVQPYPGTDAYLLAFDVDGEQILAHDPHGLPHVLYDRGTLAEAWRADCVDYNNHVSYQFWHSPAPTEGAGRWQLGTALAGFRDDYRRAAEESLLATGVVAIEEHAGALTDSALNPLVDFTLPLGAARADLYAAFFRRHGEEHLAALKQDQARVLGRTFCAAADRALPQVEHGLLALAENEREFSETLLSLQSS